MTEIVTCILLTSNQRKLHRFLHRGKPQFSQCKVQSTAKKFKELSASVGIRITFDEISHRLRGLMTGKVLLLRLNVTVQLV